MDTNRKIRFGFLGGLALLGCVALTAILATQRLIHDAQWVDHTHEVLSTVRAFDAQIREAKSDVRSFLLTSDSAYIGRYHASVDSARQSLHILEQAIADNPGQQQHLRALSSLFDARLASFEQTFALGPRAAAGLTSTATRAQLATVLAGGEALSAQIADSITAFDQAEQQLLQLRATAERNSEETVRFVIVAFVLVGAGLAWLLRRSIERDLETQQRADRAVRESEEKFSGILTIAADAIISVDEQHLIRHFNAGAEHIFGYAAGEVVGQPLEMLLPASLAAAHRRHMDGFARAPETARRMGERRQVLGRRKDGEEFPADASISKLTTSQGMLFTVVLRDVSEQKRMERHEHILADAGRKLVGSIEYEEVIRVAANLAVPELADWCVLDILEQRDDRTVFRRVVSSGGLDDSTAKTLAAHILDDDSPSLVLDVLRTGKAELITDVDEEWLEAHVDPHDQPAYRSLGARSLLIVPLESSDRIVGALTLGTSRERAPMDAADLTLARALADRATLAIENARHHANARRATAVRDEVLSIVSHDLRNPLSAVSMCARTLLDHPPDDEASRRELYRSTLDAADWMHRLMQDLLDAASIDAGRLSVDMEPQSVPQLLEAGAHVLSARAEAEQIRLAVECEHGMPLVNADAARVVQVLANLLGNAIKYSEQGSVITIGASRGTEDVTLWVRDHGSGISAEHLPHIFDRFWHLRGASRTRGTGLGLAIAQGIVTAHGGRIWVESSEGVGSTFYFTLPLAERRAAATYHAGDARGERPVSAG